MPVVSNIKSGYEAISGKDIFGNELSTADRIAAGAGIFIPGAKHGKRLLNGVEKVADATGVLKPGCAAKKKKGDGDGNSECKTKNSNTPSSKLIDSNNPEDYLNEALKRQNLDKAPSKLKETWSQDGYDIEVRAHPANPKYDKTGSIYRVARRKQGIKPGTKNQGFGWEYLGSDGKWYHTEVLKSGGEVAEQGAKATHIQLK